MKQFEISVANEDYIVRHGTPTEMGIAWGDIDSPTHKAPRCLRVRRGMTPHDHMNVVIHEILHACDWRKSEVWVEETAKDIRNVLWKMGYRLVVDPCEE